MSIIHTIYDRRRRRTKNVFTKARSSREALLYLATKYNPVETANDNTSNVYNQTTSSSSHHETNETPS